MVSRMPLTDQAAQPSPQVLLVGEKDSKRLLEVYVKRSLSLNDGAQHPHRRERGTNKWVTLAEKNKKDRKHSSDTSIHLNTSDSEEDLGKDEAFSEPETGKLQETAEKTENKSKRWKKRATLKRNDGSSASHKSDGKPKKWFLPKDKRDGKQPNRALKQESDDFRDKALPQPSLADELESSTEAKKPKDSKKSKKSSVWKTVLGWFSRGNSEKQDEKDKEAVRTEEAIPPVEPSSPPVSCLPFPDVLSNGDAVILRRKPSRRWSQRKPSLKRRSRDMGLDKAAGRPCTLDLSTANHETAVKSIEEVEPTSSYYEKVSEVLENIVHEIKNSPTEENRTFLPQPTAMNGLSMSKEEVIERIIALIKQEGDIMDPKLKENPTISSYFSMLSYGSFQQLADQYVQSELPKQKTTQPSVAAPELVKFAFTLDFTARMASLSRHAPIHILGFGNQYLKDRFTHTSESHPHNSDMTKEK